MIKTSFHIFFESLSLLVALTQFKKLKKSYMFSFIPFLAFVLLVELIASYVVWNGALNNMYLYNFAYPAMIAFYSIILLKFNSNEAQKKLQIVFLGLYLIPYVGYNVIYDQWLTFTPSLFAFGSLELIVFSCIYFYHYLRNDYPPEDKEHISGLWIAVGILIFYSGVFIVFSLHKYIVAFNLRIGGIKLHNFIPRVLSIPLYSCFIVSFLIWKPNPARK